MAAPAFDINNIRRPEGIIEGSNITKEVRHELFCQVAGGAGSMRAEHWQRNKIVEGTGLQCPSNTHMRINTRTGQLEAKPRPNVHENGFDYTEDFDGFQPICEQLVYYNLKCIVGSGGAQTRSLREVYHFVEAQAKFLLNNDDYIFVNILDGDQCSKHMDKFEYLLSRPEYQTVREKIYVGDLYSYFDWLRTRLERLN